jgi:hypothetical protein
MNLTLKLRQEIPENDLDLGECCAMLYGGEPDRSQDVQCSNSAIVVRIDAEYDGLALCAECNRRI